ncbi:hypothetical protein KC330_g566 [Hortaea werneckii]|nr:hypothetical protein KC330_g566 [Hortaea werneckii]
MLLILAASLLASTAAASTAAASTAAAKCTSYVDMFDTNAQGLQGIIPELSPVDRSATGALEYSALDYITGPGLLIVTPPSQPNVIGTGALSELREGANPGWSVRKTSDNGMPTATTFNQKSIYYLCVVNLQNSLAPPTTCTIQASGVRNDGRTVIQELVFNPGPNQDIPGNFSFAEFTPSEDWTNLTRVDLQLVNTDFLVPGTALIFDNNAYEACD